MKNKRTTTILGIIGFSLIAIIAAFKSVQDPKVAEGGSRTVTKKQKEKMHVMSVMEEQHY